MHPLKDGFNKVIYKVYENEKGMTSIYSRHNLGKHGNILMMNINSSWSLSFLITEARLLWV